MKIAVSIFSLTLWAVFSILAADQKLPTDAAKALNSSTNTILYSLEPEPLFGTTNKEATLYGHKILGQTRLGSKQAKIAFKAIEKAIAEGGTGARCFNPRHALRVTAGGQTYDFLLCYECGWISVIHQEKEVVRLGAAGTPDELNKLLTAANIPLAKSR